MCYAQGMQKLTKEELRRLLELRRCNAAQPQGNIKYNRKAKHRKRRYEE